MTALHQLDEYLTLLCRRLRWLATLRGLTLTILLALALTLLFTWIANQFRFLAGLVVPLRLGLFVALACAALFALILPLRRISRRSAARFAERRAPGFAQRLTTLSERTPSSNPFDELVAEDSLPLAAENPPERFVPSGWLAAGGVAVPVLTAVLLWLIISAPGYWGYGAALLWTGTAHTAAPLYDIHVAPGNAAIRRHTDQMIAAQLKGFSAERVTLHAKYRNALKWDEIPMQVASGGSNYQFLFPALSDSLEYFVEAGASRSPHFTISVKDLPVVQHLRVVVHAPKALQLADHVDDPGGDIRAVEGSEAQITIATDKPLEHSSLVLDNGSQIPLNVTAQQNTLSATLPIQKDGGYHISMLDGGQPVRLSENYIIEAQKDEAPTVNIARPGKDTGVSAIEELPVGVTASDDFGLQSLELHYSINGGSERTTGLLHGKNVKKVDGATLLTLESDKLSPGDLLSFYAVAKDASHTTRSDIYFAKVEPFDLKFRQSQQSGGGGGSGGEEETKISERQKEIIAATWNQVKDPARETAAVAQNEQFLSDMEGKLGAQAKALAERMSNRELSNTSAQFNDFSKSMVDAAGQMSQAVAELKPGRFTQALAPEQKALQSLLHAESVFREIQVSFGNQSGGGGGGGGGDQRDLARLFDLELDTAKNQYEQGQSAGAPSENEVQKQLDRELERLKELARRQQELASEQHTPQQQFQQRWEQEQLRREAEQLRQQMQQQLAQGSQSPSGQSQSAQSQSGQSQSSNSQSQGQAQSSAGNAAQQSSAAQREAMRRAIESLSRAENDMRSSSSKQDAANQLAQAQATVGNALHQQAANSLDDLAKQAQQLAQNQKDLSRRVKQLYGAEGIDTTRTDENGNPVLPEMNGPGYAGGWSRRHFAPPPPNGSATQSERNLAGESDKLADQMQQLDKRLQQQAQAMQTQQPDATRKIHKALSDAEQADIAVRMQKNAEWLRGGFGSKTWPIEDGITAATDRLSRQINEASSSAARNDAGSPNNQSGGQTGQAGALSDALNTVRSLREQMQRSGAAGGSQSARNDVDALNTFRSQIGKGDQQLNGYFNDALGLLRRRNAQAGLLDTRLNNAATASLERLEAELTRKILQTSGARTTSPDGVPETYREAVAAYFRNLSK